MQNGLPAHQIDKVATELLDPWFSIFAAGPLPRTHLEELYDTIDDPLERINLMSDPGHVGAADQMRSRLERWMDNTADPLRAGPIPDRSSPWPEDELAKRHAAHVRAGS